MGSNALSGILRKSRFFGAMRLIFPLLQKSRDTSQVYDQARGAKVSETLRNEVAEAAGWHELAGVATFARGNSSGSRIQDRSLLAPGVMCCGLKLIGA